MTAEPYASTQQWQTTVDTATDTAIDMATDMATIISPDFEFIEVSKGMCAATGMGREELIGRKCYEVVHGTNAPVETCPCVEALKTKRNSVNSLVQNERHLKLSAWPILDDNEDVRSLILTIEDISQQKRMEKERIQSERMRVANELSIGICHNFNNLLSGISVPAFMLNHTISNPESLREIETIISASKRAADLVYQLQLSTRGQTRENPYPVDLNEVIEQTLTLTQSLWGDQPAARGIDIKVHTELSEIPSVHGTKPSVQKMVENLIFNAVEAMPEGGDISILTQVEGDSVRFCFSDTGIGMDEETRWRVFEPFFTTKTDVGAGLGLSTLHGMLTQWGGKVDVESFCGAGTTFALYFPIWREVN
jgi:PAS domain S-box-containing protein